MADDLLRWLTEAMLLSLSVVSFALFLLIASFKGKNLIDWLLMLRDLILAIITARLFSIMVTEDATNLYMRFAQWTALTLVCLALFVSLVREHVIRHRHYLKSQEDT